MGLDPDCWGCATFAFITVLPILNFTIQISRKWHSSPDAVATVATFYAQQHRYWPLVAALTFPWYIWVWTGSIAQGLRRSRDILPCEACWLGIFLSRETGALCAVSDIPWLLSDFSFMTILLTYLLSSCWRH